MPLKVKAKEQYQNVGKGRLRGQVFDSSHLTRNQTESVPTIFYLVMTITILTC